MTFLGASIFTLSKSSPPPAITNLIFGNRRAISITLSGRFTSVNLPSHKTRVSSWLKPNLSRTLVSSTSSKGAIPGAIDRYCLALPIPTSSSSSLTFLPIVINLVALGASILSMIFKTFLLINPNSGS